MAKPDSRMRAQGRRLTKRAADRAPRAKIDGHTRWVYFNQSPVIDPADFIIMDDAHLAEHCLHSLYSVEIERSSHSDLFTTLISELHERFPEYSILADALASNVPPNRATELLSFIDQVEVADRLREIIDSSKFLTTDTDLKFRWHRIRNHLVEANIYISLNTISIRPYVYPLISNEYYSQAKQRLFMSATIGDAGDLSRQLGVQEIKKIPIPADHAEKTSGRRLIIMNRIEDADLPERLQKAILTSLCIHPKSVWLCSSVSEATKIRSIVSDWLKKNGFTGHPTLLLTPLGDEIDLFKKLEAGHLFVAGRFDGMDFSTDECRLVVLTTLPRAINLQEEFISADLRDSGFMKRRLNQRIIQALGRCNRSEEDFGMYVLADRRFATHFGSEMNRAGMPRNMIAEIDMAQDSAEIEIDDLVNQVQHFLKGEFEQYDGDLQEYLADVPPQQQSQQAPDTSTDEVVGWTALFQSKNYRIAADRFERCWKATVDANLIEIAALHGWHWAKALFLQSLLGETSAEEKSLTVFEDAINRGGRSVWFNRMRASLNRAKSSPIFKAEEITKSEYPVELIRSFDDLLDKWGPRKGKFDKWCTSLSVKLQSEKHTEYQEGLEELGELLGYRALRPKHEASTDCRWRGVFGNVKELITFEAKIEHTDSGKITPSNVGQAHIQLNRAQREYQKLGYTVRGTIVTHLKDIASEAEASAGNIRIIEKEAILELWNQVKLLFSLYRDKWSSDDVAARQAAAQNIWHKLPPTGWLIRALDIDERFVGVEHLLTEWG